MFKRVYFFLVVYLGVVIYSQTLLLLWFYKNGLSVTGILSYYLIQFGASLLGYLLLEGKSISSRKAFLIGILANAVPISMASFVPHTWHAFVVTICFAVNNIFFWTVYNAYYFKYSDKDNHGFNSGIYFLMTPILGAVLSPFAGFVAEKFGYTYLFITSGIIYIIPLIYVYYLPVLDFKFNTKNAFWNFENKSLIFFQGYLSMFSFAFIPIVTLSLINSADEFGNFFGFLAIISTFVAFFNSKISDKLKNRKLFYYVFTIFESLSYVAMAFVQSLTSWHIVAGVNNIAENLVNPFNVALVLDHAKLSVEDTMLAREIYFDIGRVVAALFAIIIYLIFGTFLSVLVFMSLTSLLHPLVAYYNKVYLE